MSVRLINGQSNALVVLKGLLQQNGLPTLTSEGIEALSTKFETGLVIGNGVVSHDGRPLIDVLQAVHADPDARRRFFEPAEPSTPVAANNLTESWRAEIAAGRKQSMPDDWNVVRGRYSSGSVTAAHMDELAVARRPTN